MLAADEYWEAYQSGQPFLQLMKALWGQEQLVFVRFGFSDPWLDFIAGEAIREAGGRWAAPRHVALTGLSRAYTPEMRTAFHDQYNADPLFYPVTQAAGGTENHAALLVILKELCAKTAKSTGGADDGRDPPPHADADDVEHDPSPSDHHKRMVIDTLAKAGPYLRAAEAALKAEFGKSRKGAAAVVDFFAVCDAERALDLFIVVRVPLRQETILRLDGAARQLTEKAAAALYCLAACRLVDVAAVRAGHTRASGGLSHLIRINSGEPLVWRDHRHRRIRRRTASRTPLQ